jgi:CRISPR-associated protein Cas1
LRIIDISNSAARVRSSNDLLVIESNGSQTTYPFSSVAVLVLSNPQISVTQLALADLVSAGGVVVICDKKFHPAGLLLPIVGNFEQTSRIHSQIFCPQPRLKRSWQTIIKEKILAQSDLLKETTGEDGGLRYLAGIVSSGDAQNVEARAAAIYWRKLLGTSFRRHREDFQNSCLNFGYAILRAATARAICAAGLCPSVGLHHKNQRDAFCLADDLMEPFRPVIDSVVVSIPPEEDFKTNHKNHILQRLVGRFDCDGECRMLFDILAQVSQSLVRVMTDGEEIKIPKVRELRNA